MGKNSKNYLIVALIIVCSILLYSNIEAKKSIESKENEIKELNNNITAYENNEKQLKDDKLFYKNLYIDLAEDYNDRLEKLGIDEYILTDTSR